MATANPARLLGIEVGALAEGARADLVVMRIDPEAGRSEVLRTIVGGEVVYTNGKYA
jgi:imidazolonepropionase-like amidohydrolase